MAERLLSPIARNVKRLRLQRGWSQQMLAAHANVSAQTINNIERGWVWWPQTATMMGLTTALGVSSQTLRIAPDEETENWQSHLTKLEQQKLGARWVEAEGRLVIDPTGTDSDAAAAQESIVQQLHIGVVQKARLFHEISKRLDNAIGWHGIAAASQRFTEGVSRPTNEVVAHLGSIYSAILELGSFLEQDVALQQGSRSSADPLDPEVHRTLTDLIRTAAPWLRQFPTVRELDDESAAFLTQNELLDPGAALIISARDNAVVSSTDAAAIGGLIEAARRGELQSLKAKTRGLLSIRNLLYASAVVVVGFLGNATASNYAEQSPLIKHSGAFLANAEASIEEFITNLPADLRTAFQQLIKEIREHGLADAGSPPHH